MVTLTAWAKARASLLSKPQSMRAAWLGRDDAPLRTPVRGTIQRGHVRRSVCLKVSVMHEDVGVDSASTYQPSTDQIWKGRLVAAATGVREDGY